MAQNYKVTPPFAGQQLFSESIYQLAASNGLGRHAAPALLAYIEPGTDPLYVRRQDISI